MLELSGNLSKLENEGVLLRNKKTKEIFDIDEIFVGMTSMGQTDCTIKINNAGKKGIITRKDYDQWEVIDVPAAKIQ